MTLEIEIGGGPLTFLLILLKLSMGLDYTVSSGPFLNFEIKIGDGPGPELDNIRFLCKMYCKFPCIAFLKVFDILHLTDGCC